MKSKRANYPKWVEEFRGEGREIKKVGSCYYLYTFKTNVNNLVVVWYQEREYSIKLTEI